MWRFHRLALQIWLWQSTPVNSVILLASSVCGDVCDFRFRVNYFG